MVKRDDIIYDDGKGIQALYINKHTQVPMVSIKYATG